MSTTQARAETAASMRDTESRFMLQPTTKTGEWDQVTGVSQGIINKNFENLFKLYPKMASMDARIGKARIEAKLSPPRILIPAGTDAKNSSQVLYLMRFASGVLFDSEGEFLIEDLKGWEIAFSIELGKFSDDASKNPPTQEEYEASLQKKHVGSLRESLTVNGKPLPGRYSVERLYAHLSSAEFGSPDKTHSKAVEGGKIVSWSQWLSRNRASYFKLKNFLENWALDQDTAGRNVCGYSISLKDEPTGLKPTFEPTDMVHQVYPYKQNESAKSGTTGDDLLASRNAFLFCEMTEGRVRPDDYSLIWSGNFCTMPSHRDAQDAIEGTFLMNRKLFMESFLLSRFRELNQAMEVCHISPYGQQAAKEEDKRVFCYMPYHASWDPQNPSVTSPCYDFKNLNPENHSDLANGYHFNKINYQPKDTEYVEFKNKNPGWSNLKGGRVRDEMTVDVTWSPGSPILFVKGTITSDEIAYWDQGGDIKPGDPSTWNKSDLWAWMTDKFVGGWDMKLTIKTSNLPPHQNGILDVDIDTGPNQDCNINLVSKSIHHNMDENGHMEQVLADLRNRFKKVVPTLAQSIKDSLRGSGRFFFPGSGVFSFKNPRFTKWGDLVAEIDYLPLAAGKLLLVPQPVPEPTVEPPSTKVKLLVMTAPTSGHSLTWAPVPSPSALASAKREKLVFRGTNINNQPVGLQEVRFYFTGKRAGGNLFYTNKFFCKGEEPAPPQPPAKTEQSSDTSNPVTKEEPASDKKSLSPTSDASKTKSEKDGSEVFEVVEKPEDKASDDSKVNDSEVTDTNQVGDGKATQQTTGTPDLVTIDVAPRSNTTMHPPVGKSPSDQSPDQDVSENDLKAGNEGSGLLNKIKGAVREFKEILPNREPEYGIVSVNSGIKDAQLTSKVVCQNAKRFNDAPVGKWQVTVDEKDETLYFQPGEWIEIVVEAPTNLPGIHQVRVDEEFIATNGAHWSEDYNVRLK